MGHRTQLSSGAINEHSVQIRRRRKAMKTKTNVKAGIIAILIG